MKYYCLLGFSGLLLVTNISWAQLTGEDSIAYINEILEHRKAIDKQLKKEDKPLLPEDRKQFKGLDYFSIKVNYRAVASFERNEKPDTLELKTNKKWTPQYASYGVLSFMLDSVPYKLHAYQNVKQATQDWYDGELFIPFKDKTSGQQTNENGRVLHFTVADSQQEEIILDFNKAFNPYCRYNPRYTCPYPPEENYLNTEILAGESDYRYGK